MIMGPNLWLSLTLCTRGLDTLRGFGLSWRGNTSIYKSRISRVLLILSEVRADKVSLPFVLHLL